MINLEYEDSHLTPINEPAAHPPAALLIASFSFLTFETALSVKANVAPTAATYFLLNQIIIYIYIYKLTK